MRNFILGIIAAVITALVVMLVKESIFDEDDVRGDLSIYESRVELPRSLGDQIAQNLKTRMGIDSDHDRSVTLDELIAQYTPTALQMYSIKSNERRKNTIVKFELRGFLWAIIDEDPTRLIYDKEVFERTILPGDELKIVAASSGGTIFPHRFWSGGTLLVSTDGYYYDAFKIETPFEGLFSINMLTFKNAEIIGFLIFLVIAVFLVTVAIFILNQIFGAEASKSEEKGRQEGTPSE